MSAVLKMPAGVSWPVQGHHADGSSIQKHSAGSHYPFIVQVQEYSPHCDDERKRGHCYVDVLKPGGCLAASFHYDYGNREQMREALRLGYESAENHAAVWKAQRAACAA